MVIAKKTTTSICKYTSNADNVDLPQPLVPHKSTVTDSFRSRILPSMKIVTYSRWENCTAFWKWWQII